MSRSNGQHLEPHEPLLEARGLAAGYHGHPVVRDVTMAVRVGEVVALLGPNGAGKTTTLLTLAGHLKPLAGEVLIEGRAITSPAHFRARRGLALVTEERSVFMRLTAAQNLQVGGCSVPDAVALFPELEPLLGRRAGLLSGGEQQILAVALALSRKPKLLLADELSLGLAPRVVTRLLDAVRDVARERGLGVLIVEQHVQQALAYADRVYVMRRGSIVLSGTVEEMRPLLQEAYL
jgi:branched-chain amino acid transport system ATP-binding protein